MTTARSPGRNSLLDRVNQTFQHRSGRVIAIGRLVLACAFLLAIWLDPSQPTRAPAEGYAILAAYVLVAGLLLVVTWSNWWLDRRLALPAHVLDIAVFTVMVFLTEGYTSPFFTFFVFLLLAATIRWGWRETAVTAAVVIPLFLAAGVAALVWGGGEFELRRFLIRGAYLFVLSLILIWFGVHQRSGRNRQVTGLDAENAGEATRSLIQRMLEFAAERTGASRVVFAWSEEEEPWLNVAAVGREAGFEHERFGPETFEHVVAPELAASSFIFDAGKPRVLVQEAAGRTRIASAGQVIEPGLAARFGIERGMVVPVETEDHSGHLFLLDVPGLCSDSLKIGKAMGDEIAGSLERLSTLKVSEESAAARTRRALARDLHDSVVQLLAGTSFRLESIRRSAMSGRDVSAAVDALQQELSREQRELRGFITKLRGHGGSEAADICEALGTLTDRLSRQWGIECALIECSSAKVAGPLEHDLHQLVREAVANAVRHGNASRVTISFVASGGAIGLEIVDNGSGFPVAGDFSDEDPVSREMIPWSLSERVRSLGGRLALSSSSAGSRVRIDLPLEVPA